MLRHEYEGITGTSVYPDIYRDLIEPLYLEAPPWMTKYDFCASINAKALSEVPAVPDCFYFIYMECFKCVKVDMMKKIIQLESQATGKVHRMSFKTAAVLRKKESMRPA